MASKEDAVRTAGKVMDAVFEKGVDEELSLLEGEELLAEDVLTIRVHAQGETLVDASNDLFKALRNKVFFGDRGSDSPDDRGKRGVRPSRQKRVY